MTVSKTRDFTPTVTLYLIADTIRQIEEDTTTYRELEDAGLFELKPLAARHRLIGNDTAIGTTEGASVREGTDLLDQHFSASS